MTQYNRTSIYHKKVTRSPVLYIRAVSFVVELVFFSRSILSIFCDRIALLIAIYNGNLFLVHVCNVMYVQKSETLFRECQSIDVTHIVSEKIDVIIGRYWFFEAKDVQTIQFP